MHTNASSSHSQASRYRNAEYQRNAAEQPSGSAERHHQRPLRGAAHLRRDGRIDSGERELSLGKVNFCLQALISKGWIKATNFKNSKKKSAYMYLLTPRGIEERARVAARFLKFKMQEYEALRGEIEAIRDQVLQGRR